ncbi:Cation-chloride cotransporter 1 [Vitis vinifera]|uniref:Cation-chloride cotransporter 1 n=1 Tax=Vitis vinifera TaxID=29760 RepID=A0A438DVI6_VITVI|nr:Cation-chloride cotransporter 1 [Vitis vinifera]
MFHVIKLSGMLLTATIAWPLPAIIYIGIILSTLGAALQSLTGAPRLLAAIANDDILPVLHYFRVAEGSEPHIATLFTALICIGCSSWRPRWKFHHWSLSLLGAVLCIVIMFLISWSFTVVSLALASLIYYYVCIKGKAGDWGDGFKSAYFQLALRSLRSLGYAYCLFACAFRLTNKLGAAVPQETPYTNTTDLCKYTDEEWFDDFEVVLPVLAVVSGLKPYGQMLFSSTLYFGSDQPVRLAYILGFRSRASCPYGANYIDASSFSVYFGILPFHL